MKQETKRWLTRVLFVALVAAGTLIAAPRIAVARDCPFPSAGTCPPLSNSDNSCRNACVQLGYPSGGECPPSGGPGCCVCFE